MSESETAVRIAEKPDTATAAACFLMRACDDRAAPQACAPDILIAAAEAVAKGEQARERLLATGGSVRSGPLGFDRSRLDGKIGSRCGDLVIVASERAVLVVPRGQTQRVGEAIAALEARRNGGSDNG